MGEFMKKAFANMKEDAVAQHEIDKENFETMKATENPDFKEFRTAKGIKAKMRVLAEHAERNGKEIRTKQRDEYSEMLRKQREHMSGKI